MLAGAWQARLLGAAPPVPRSSFLLHHLLEAGHGPLPERVELVTQRRDPGLVEPVDPLRALGAVVHQTDMFEHFQVLRHRRLADWERLRQLTNGALPLR